MVFPATPLDMRLLFAFGASVTAASSTWTWTDCTGDLRTGTDQSMTIKVGRSDRSAQAEPNNATFEVNNFTGQYTPDNPSGSNYPSVVENVPCVLAVTRSTNSGFVSDVSGWTAVNCSIARSTVHTYVGSGAMLLTPTGGFTSASAKNTTGIPVRAYASVYVDAWVYSVAGYSAATVAVDWSDSSHVFISTTSAADVVIPAGTWTYLGAFLGPAPSNAAYCVGKIQMDGSPANTDLLWIDEARTSLPRFSGYVDGWTPTFDATGLLPIVAVSASGLRRRMGQGTPPASSALYRTVTKSQAGIILYMPLEDGSSTVTPTNLYTASSTTPQITGTVKFAGYSSNLAAGTQAVPDFTGGGQISAAMTYGSHFQIYVGSYNWTAECAFAGPTSAPAGDMAIIRWVHPTLLNRTTNYILALNHTTPGIYLSIGGSTVLSYAMTVFDGSMHHVAVEHAVPNVGAGTLTLYVDDVAVASTSASDHGWPTSLLVNNGSTDGFTGNIPTCSHVLFTTLTYAGTHGSALGGYIGETAAARITRVSAEEGVPLQTIVNPSSSVQMGAQVVGNYLGILDECETADGGLLHEPRDFFGYAYVVRRDCYNLTPALTLDHSLNQVANPFSPVHDDALRRNDQTIERTNGGSARYTGAATNGAYSGSQTVTVVNDSLLANIASWFVNLGSQRRRIRYPTLNVEFAATPVLFPVWLAAPRGSGVRVQVTNPITQLSPDTLDLFISGYAETIGLYGWALSMVCSPYDPWRVVQVGDTVLGRLSSAGSTLSAAYTSTATSLSVATATGSQLWTTQVGDLPFDIAIAGERMTVTAITGSSSPQVFTVTRSVNGVAKGQASGAVVSLWQPGVVGL